MMAGFAFSAHRTYEGKRLLKNRFMLLEDARIKIMQIGRQNLPKEDINSYISPSHKIFLPGMRIRVVCITVGAINTGIQLR